MPWHCHWKERKSLKPPLSNHLTTPPCPPIPQVRRRVEGRRDISAVRDLPPHTPQWDREKGKAEKKTKGKKTRVNKKAPLEPPNRTHVTHSPPNLGEEKKVASLYPTCEQEQRKLQSLVKGEMMTLYVQYWFDFN